ncbi:coleoptile phototropism protein 1-like [Apium graveolens]|uniref:coleoptile phototropism protein 1-like n=1 Tax=Apium graveolens TaxID=4045 RepID=UPI003D7A90A1
MDPHATNSGGLDIQCFHVLENEYTSNLENLHDGWWFKDLLLLRIDHFTQVMLSCKGKGIRSKLLGSCIALWTAKWLSNIPIEFHNLSHKKLTVWLYRVTIRSLIALLPDDDDSVSYNFILHLFKLGQVVKLDSDLLKKLERRLAVMLENCDANELLVRNYRHGDTSYDVGIVGQVVDVYVSLHFVKSLTTLHAVGRLIDEYLTLVARDDNLPPVVFQSLIEALPKSCRTCDNNLYRAIDMYLKAHPSLNEEERNGLCGAIEYNKLSQEARSHALRNDRLSLNIITPFILVEQVNVTSSVTAAGSDYYRTKSQTIMKVTKNISRKFINSANELKTMKLEVDAMKEKLSQLQKHVLEND